MIRRRQTGSGQQAVQQYPGALLDHDESVEPQEEGHPREADVGETLQQILVYELEDGQRAGQHRSEGAGRTECALVEDESRIFVHLQAPSERRRVVCEGGRRHLYDNGEHEVGAESREGVDSTLSDGLDD